MPVLRTAILRRGFVPRSEGRLLRCLGGAMSRERLLRLAAVAAADPAPSENEANAAGRILARLICAHPELVAVEGGELNGANAMDPIVGAVVREAAAAAGDLFRDYFGRKVAREAAKTEKAKAAKVARLCPICGAAPAPGVRLPLATGAEILRCERGHSFFVAGPARPGPRKTTRAGRAK